MTAEHPAVRVMRGNSASACVLLCEHASNYIPPEYANLGLPQQELERHIAWDIGAAHLALRLSARLDAPLFLAGCSRLVIDLNRPLGSSTSIPAVSEATAIPGNERVGPAERSRRAREWFEPFHASVKQFLDRRAASGVPTYLVGVHSFTPVYLGVRRSWHAGVLYARAAAFGTALIKRLAAVTSLDVGDNEPYRIEAEYDYTVPVHGDARGIDAVLLEVRQDLLATSASLDLWAAHIAAALADSAPFGRTLDR